MSKYSASVEAHLDGCRAVSIGNCPTCPVCMDIDGFTDETEHEDAWSSEDLPSSEPSFSWSRCGVCGSRLGGDRYPWHWLDENNEIQHEDDACIDCVFYITYGDEPDEEEQC